MIREARARLSEWWRPTLAIPTVPAAAEQRLPEICGLAQRGRVVVVTTRGVEIPIHLAQGWSVVEFRRTLAQIENLPETPERP